MLSRFAYLFLALPNPPGDLIKSLERMFFKFLWNKGPDRITRKQIVKNVESGGLRMIEINAFITSLKVTWLRRLILNSENDNWSLLSGLNFNELVCLGDQYFKSKIRNLHNPFLKYFLKSLHTFYSVIKLKNWMTFFALHYGVIQICPKMKTFFLKIGLKWELGM